MNTKARRSLHSIQAHSSFRKHKVEMQSSFTMDPHEPTSSRRGSIRERKMALQQDVDKLKKRLRHEENVHRALERAFTRPPGALPRLPPYLPPQTLELVAEVAVLEEEVVRLEEKVVHFRQGLYQEAVYTSLSKKNMDNFADLCDTSQIKDPKPRKSKSLLHIEANSAANISKNLPSLSDDRRRKENQSSTNSSKNKQLSPNSVLEPVRGPVENHSIKSRPVERRLDPHRLRLERQLTDHEGSERKDLANQEEISTAVDNPNNISESILKCLMNIFVKMSSKKNKSTDQTLPSLSELSASERLGAQCRDLYNLFPRFGVREIGPYKHLISIGDTSIDPDRTTISIFLVQRLKVLFRRLATVNLKGLSHQERLAFWINIYNSCMMNAFIEYGIPESPERIVELMQMATVNVGGHILNAITIEHFILRLPYHSKYTFSKGAEHGETMTRSLFGLELSEPLVTFALSCGSWSSPAVRVYTATRVEEELETAKTEYLQAAVGVSTVQKCIALPKLMDWYLLDFAKDFESLLDWICLQLPPELGKEAMKCLESRRDEPFLECLQILPYEFKFRYLFRT